MNMPRFALQLLRHALAVLMMSGLAAAAEPLPAPTGNAILTIDGSVPVTNSDGVAVFDLAMLETLGAKEIKTSTIWTKGEISFVGVPLKTLLERVGVTEGTLQAVAANDYSVTVPVSDAVEDGPIIAYLRDGKPMSVRDNGPLWIIYPFDADARFRSEEIYARSIWHLIRITVQD